MPKKKKERKRKETASSSLVRVELESEPGLGDVESRPVAGVLKDGVTVEPGAASQHHKPGFIYNNKQYSFLKINATVVILLLVLQISLLNTE